MEKNKVILEIMDLYDEVQTLRNTVIWLKEQLTNKEVTDAVAEPNTPSHYKFLMDAVIKEGKKVIIDNTLYWDHCKCGCWLNEETQQYEFNSFDNWLLRKGAKDHLHNSFSYNDFINFFEKELYEMYEEEKQNALAKAKAGREEQRDEE